MIDCQDVLNKLFDYIDNEMDGIDAANLKAHLDLCHDCFDRVQFEMVLRINLQKKTSHLCPEKLKAKIQKLIEKF